MKHAPVSIVRTQARGQDFQIVRVAGNLFICSKANGSCCCGWQEKGRMPFDNSLWSDEWERRKNQRRLQLTFSGCLGPCAVGNNAMLHVHGQSFWIKDLNDPVLVPAVFDYVESMLDAGRVLPLPASLHAHVFDRYLPPTEGACESSVRESESDR